MCTLVEFLPFFPIPSSLHSIELLARTTDKADGALERVCTCELFTEAEVYLGSWRAFSTLFAFSTPRVLMIWMESISPFSGKRKVSLLFRRSSVLSLFPSRLSRSRSPSKITLILFFGLFFVEDREFECLGWELHVILSYRVGDTLAEAEPISIQYI